MNSIFLQAASNAALYLIQSLLHNGVYLLISISLAVALKLYLDAEKVRRFLYRKPGMLIPGSVATGALTPLCACGTMAVIFSLVGSSLPWGPIMAFLVSSPLMSPDTFILISGFLGSKFAVVLTLASIILGLAAGYLTWIIEIHSGFLDDQLKVIQKNSIQHNASIVYSARSMCGCGKTGEPVNLKGIHRIISNLRIDRFGKELYELGIKKILPLFALFILIAYAVKTYMPTSWIVALFSGDHFYSVPLSSLIGLPLYVSDASVVPLLQVFKNAGASNGALLAFLISGPATSLGVIGGLSLILKKRAIGLYIGFIFVGAILLGYAVDFLALFINL